MKTIGYGLFQVPVVSQYRLCCIRRSLAGGVTSTGWQEILACSLRILLLSSWGLQSIDYSLPQTAEKIIGVYVEFAILALQVANGIVILIGLWANNLFFMYPSFIIIPTCFVTDIIIKGSCYAALFLTPKATVFGVFSLIEVWIRGFSLMYGWIIIISFVYYKKKDWELTKVDVELNTRSPGRVSTLLRRTSSKSPFSRNSSLSRRGRHSFLLKKGSKRGEKELNGNAEKGICEPNNGTLNSDQEAIPIYAEIGKRHPIVDMPAPYPESEGRETNSSFNNNTMRITSDSGRDGESEILLGESATMSMRRPIAGTKNNPEGGGQAYASGGEGPPIPVRHKKRGGFVPEVLRTPSKLESSEKPPLPKRLNVRQHSPSSSYSESTTTANTIEFSSTHGRSVSGSEETASLLKGSKPPKGNSTKASAHSPARGPPTLPSKPPVGGTYAKKPKSKESGIWNWVSPASKKNQSDRDATSASSSLLKKHVQDPVLV